MERLSMWGATISAAATGVARAAHRAVRMRGVARTVPPRPPPAAGPLPGAPLAERRG
jgi:hypothetical protein